MQQLTIRVVTAAAMLIAALATMFAPTASAANGTISTPNTHQMPDRGAPAPINASPPSAPSGSVTPDTTVAHCPDRPDFFAIYTQYHGAVCYANAGTIYYGGNPPITTWTTYGICTGNNAGDITFWVDGEWFTQPFSKFTCYDWFHNWGTTVEVSGFTIY